MLEWLSKQYEKHTDGLERKHVMYALPVLAAVAYYCFKHAWVLWHQ